MGREIKRVPLDFDWPLNEVWAGYLMPEAYAGKQCPDCGIRAVGATMQPPVVRIDLTADGEPGK